MRSRPRIYDEFLREHFAQNQQMSLVSGPRQVGKTTTCRGLADAYANWDNVDDRERILAGPRALVDHFDLNRLREEPPLLFFDELHKYRRWKSFLKGFYDSYKDRARVMVTGSSRMDVYRRGGDSLMGRYFHYRMHPFSVAETITTSLPDPDSIIRPPKKPKPSEFDALWTHGGYPEPFVKRDSRFSRRWQSLRFEQLVREDIRDMTQVQQLDQMSVLVQHLASRSAEQLVYSNLAKHVRISVDTARRWIDILRDLHLGFLVRPWFRNVSRSLRKEPKWYLRDWSSIDDAGARTETFIACHLLKAVEGWTDLGLGKFELGYLRDKEGREVDFVVVRDGKPWFLVEAKHAEGSIAKSLGIYQEMLKVPYAFQVVFESPFVDSSAFATDGRPIAVPARTLLSQLI